MAEEEKKKEGQGLIVTTSQAAALLGRSTKFIQILTKDGYIPQLGRGRYHAQAVIRGTISYYEDKLKDATKSAAATSATLARTREIEMRTAERARSLIPIEDALNYHAELAQQVRAEFAGLPARVTRDVDLRRAMEAAIDDIFARLAAKARERSAALRSGRLDLDPVGQD